MYALLALLTLATVGFTYTETHAFRTGAAQIANGKTPTPTPDMPRLTTHHLATTRVR